MRKGEVLQFLHEKIIYLNKKIRPIFMVLYLLVQLRCLSESLSNVRQTKVGIYLISSSYLEELLNLK